MLNSRIRLESEDYFHGFHADNRCSTVFFGAVEMTFNSASPNLSVKSQASFNEHLQFCLSMVIDLQSVAILNIELHPQSKNASQLIRLDQTDSTNATVSGFNS